MMAAFLGLSGATAWAGDWLIDPSPYKAQIVKSDDGREVQLSNGLVRRTIRLSPNAATVALDNLMTGQSEIRSVRPEARITLDGTSFDIGGLVGQPVHNYLLPSVIDSLKSDPKAFAFVDCEIGSTAAPFDWKKRAEWMSHDAPWPAPGKSVALTFKSPEGAKAPGVNVIVHYELYDGLPLISKWIEVKNGGEKAVKVDSFISEILATVENTNSVDNKLPEGMSTEPRSILVETDFAFAGMDAPLASKASVHWKPDPLYATQVNYERQTPCLLEVAPPIGPAQTVEPGKTFTSFRTYELLHDSTDRERRGLAARRMYRAIAPWSQENPILMHVRSAKPDAVKLAVDQCAEVGFEMIIMTFGSGVNVENPDPKYMADVKALVDYAHSKKIALGAYSLLASRSVNAENDVINPKTGKPGGFATFGNSPCIGSPWGQNYFAQLKKFYETTGFDVLEHDGSYPGDACASTTHPGHVGYDDSQWNQWKTITDYYHWCRSRGIYLNVPDWYFLSGSNKTGMGYRENNWSLPRAQQELIERQNIYDGTWEKTPSMGWMFVPLTEYHGGGAEATIEPLSEHLDHYESRLANLFGSGVQACYRGPRLYDTDATRDVVKKWVTFYKDHRAILDSDVIHLRRPDGRDWDGLLHVSTSGPERGLAVLHNPLDEDITRDIKLPLYYTGLTDSAMVRVDTNAPAKIPLARDYSITVNIKIPKHSRAVVVIASP